MQTHQLASHVQSQDSGFSFAITKALWKGDAIEATTKVCPLAFHCRLRPYLCESKKSAIFGNWPIGTITRSVNLLLRIAHHGVGIAMQTMWCRQ